MSHTSHVTHFGVIISAIDPAPFVYILNYLFKTFSTDRIQYVKRNFAIFISEILVWILFLGILHTQKVLCESVLINCMWNAYKNCVRISSAFDITTFLIWCPIFWMSAWPCKLFLLHRVYGLSGDLCQCFRIYSWGRPQSEMSHPNRPESKWLWSCGQRLNMIWMAQNMSTAVLEAWQGIPYFSCFLMKYLNEQFPDKWIGHGGPQNWPPWSPALMPVDFLGLHEKHKSWGNSISIVSDYWLEYWVTKVRSAAEAEDFPSLLCPDQLWGSPRLLSDGYWWSFPGVKLGWGATLTTHPDLVLRSRMSRIYTSSPLVACMAVAGQLYFFTLHGKHSVWTQSKEKRGTTSSNFWCYKLHEWLMIDTRLKSSWI
jgi:hypothetical protein